MGDEIWSQQLLCRVLYTAARTQTSEWIVFLLHLSGTHCSFSETAMFTAFAVALYGYHTKDAVFTTDSDTIQGNLLLIQAAPTFLS
jgi:hypothetical protein